jgi:Tfp pilus assembly protein PilO
MNSTLSGHFGYVNNRSSARGWADGLRVPLAAWSTRRRLAIASLIAALVFGLGTNAWVAADLSGIDASRASLAQAQHRFDDARGALDALPALRRSAGVAQASRPAAPWTSSDDVRAVTQLAERSGISLLALEPGVVSGEGIDAARPIRLTAQAGFAQLMAFVRALPSLPVLAVPGDITVSKADAAGTGSGLLSVGITLSVFDGLRPFESIIDAIDDAFDGDEDIVFNDPFAPPSRFEQRVTDVGDAALRVVGLLSDLVRGLALVETPDGETTLEAGQRIGNAHVAHVDGHGMTLATHDGDKRVVAFGEALP